MLLVFDDGKYTLLVPSKRDDLRGERIEKLADIQNTSVYKVWELNPPETLFWKPFEETESLVSNNEYEIILDTVAIATKMINKLGV